MIKKSMKRGHVKKVEREGCRLVVLGPLNKHTGLYLEKTISLHCVEPAAGWEREAFEYLRHLVVGREVEFNDFDLGDKVTADVFVDKRNVAYLMAAEGLVKHFQAGQKTSSYYSDLVEADGLAQKEGKGQYQEMSAEEARKRKRKPKRPELEALLGKEVGGWIEEVNFKLDFQVYIAELDDVVQASFAGVMLPVVNKEHVTHLRNFCSKHVYQRLRPLRLKQVTDEATGESQLFLVELNNSDEDSVLRNLFLHGYCRLEKEAAGKLGLVEVMALRSLQDQGMQSGRGIWKDYKGKLPQADKRTDANSELAKLLKAPEFEAKVVAVHSGDSVTVESAGGQSLRLNFTNLKARSMGNPSRDEASQPWAFEAKEHLRKKTIGKQVTVRIDNVRNVVTEERTFDVINATLTMEGVPVALEMVEKGLLALAPPRSTDPASSALVAYSEAARKAELAKKGIHSSVQPVRSFWDLSRPELRKKAKSEFALENHKGLNAGVVENVISASRFKVRFDQENCYFVLSLNSVRGVPNNVNDPVEERWANEALDFSKTLATQRDVKFEIEQVDKNGVAHGSLFVGKDNVGVLLLRRGLAFVEKGFRHSKNIDELVAVQEEARAAKKGIWGDQSLNLAAVGVEAEDRPKGEVKLVLLSEFFGASDFYLQENASEEFAKVARVLAKSAAGAPPLKEPLLPGTVGIGSFEGEFNRVRVIRKKKDDYEVEFIDYGNTGTLRISELRQCPAEVARIRPLAFNARLDYVQVPPAGSSYSRETDRFFEKLGVNAKLKCLETRKEGQLTHVLLWPASVVGEDVRKSLNYALVRDGLAVLGENAEGSVWDEAAQRGSEKNPEFISFMNNMD